MAQVSIRHYTDSDWMYLVELVNSWEFKPLQSHDHWSLESLTNHCLNGLAASLESPSALRLVAESQGKLVGFALLKELPWDSEQIGYNAAQLEYFFANGSYWVQYANKARLLKMVLSYCYEKNVELLNSRLNASDLSGIHILEQAGFIYVDGILCFIANIRERAIDRSQDTANINIRLATHNDRDAIVNLSRTTFIYDRFHSDPFISAPQADNLHAAWLSNSFNGGAADTVIVAEDDGGLLGFLTCKLQHSTKVTLGKLIGSIVLVGTAKRGRRMGLARQMTAAALNWFQQQGADIVEVGTQFRNIPACRLYQSCGFRHVSSSISLHKLFRDEPSKNISL